MFVRIVSDLHLEFGPLDIPELSEDKNTVLILAGDIGLAQKTYTYKEFFEDVSSRFLAIVYILGNHEHYKGEFLTSLPKIRETLADLKNVHVIEKESVVIDGVAFIGATLWTDMNSHDVVTIAESGYSMNDYKIIRNGPCNVPWQRKLHPHDTIDDHIKAKRFIFKEIKKMKEAGHAVVVVTHHGPSYLSVAECYKGDNLNGAYVTELFEDIMDAQPTIWCHGHTHVSFDYFIGDTRVICNPRGYVGYEENPDFDIKFGVEV